VYRTVPVVTSTAVIAVSRVGERWRITIVPPIVSTLVTAAPSSTPRLVHTGADANRSGSSTGFGRAGAVAAGGGSSAPSGHTNTTPATSTTAVTTPARTCHRLIRTPT
jgi:hypothetical protein